MSLHYSYEEAKRRKAEWIKTCAGCVDSSGSKDYIQKACFMCVHSPYAPCGEEKKNWYCHFSDTSLRDKMMEEYMEEREEKKKKYLERQAQKKNN